MSRVLVYLVGNTMVVRLPTVKDDAGTLQTGGSGTAKVYDASGTELGSGNFVESPSGTYRAVLAHTIAVSVGQEVDVEAILDVAGQRGRWRERVPVTLRGIS